MKKIKLLSVLIFILLLLCSCTAKNLPETSQTQSEVSLSELSEFISESSTESFTTQADTTRKEETTTFESTTVLQTTSETTQKTTFKTTASTTTKPAQTTKAKVTTTKKASENKSETTKKATVKETTTKKEIKQTTSKTTTTKPATTAKPTMTAAQKEQSFCYVTVDIRNIKRNPDMLKNEKKAFVTADGYIIKNVKVLISPGDTAFDALKKACKENSCTDNCKYCKNGIQLESTFTPAFGSYYVKGIHQLYEMDCGSMSGWMYSVNGNFADVASSEYKVKNGDKVVFAYTCDMGEDLGQSY